MVGFTSGNAAYGKLIFDRAVNAYYVEEIIVTTPAKKYFNVDNVEVIFEDA